MNKINKILGIAAVLIIGILLLASFPSIMLRIASTDVVTQNYQKIPSDLGDFTSTSKIIDKVVAQGTSGTEMLDDTQYVSSWLTSGKSEKIQVSGSMDYWNAAFDNPTFWWPAVLIGNYYYKVTLYPASGGSKILIDNNYKDPSVILSTGSYSPSKFPNIAGQYQTNWGKFVGSKSWWTLQYKYTGGPSVSDYYKYTSPLTTTPLLFYFNGPVVGYIITELYVEVATIKVHYINLLNADVTYNYNTVKLQSDQAEIKSGDGQVDTTSKNSLSGVPGYTADGTGEPYTKYVYTEGQTVTFHIKTATSGQTTGQNTVDKRWKLELLKGGTLAAIEPVYFNDNYEGDWTWKIPVGSFSSTGDNSWTIRLTNGLLVQSEAKVFVVSELNKIPGKTTFTSPSSGATYTLGQSVTVNCKASPNPNTLSPISRFDGWAKYGSSTSANYAFSSSQIPASSGQGTFTFKPDRTGKVYIMVHAIDQANNAGQESDVIFIVVTSQPKYLVTVMVTDSAGAAVSDAIVVFGSNTQNTVNGITQFTVEAGNYNLIVSKTGYTTYAGGTISVTAAKNVPVILTSTTPGPTPPGPTSSQYNLTVTVHSDSNVAIPGVLVSAVDLNGTIVSGTTDGAGLVKLLVASGLETISASVEGYEPYASDPVDVVADTPKTITMTAVIPVPPGQDVAITITVTDAVTKASLDGVTVTIGQVTGTTVSGKVILTMPSTTASTQMTIGKSGYTTYSTTIYPTGNMEFPIPLTPSKSTPGFEMIGLVVAIGIALILFRKRNK